MKNLFDQVDRFVEALLRGRRPRRFRIEDREDLDAIRVAAALAAEGNQSAAEPRPGFLERLRQRLAAQAARSPLDSRRRFIAAALAGLAGGLGGFGVGRLTQPAAPAQPSAPGIPIVRDNGRWFTVARLSDLSERATLRFSAGALEGHLVRLGGEVTALSAICSHMPCSLVWREADDDFLCPCHDATFYPDGELKFARRPYPPLTRFRARVEEGQVFVWSIELEGTDGTGRPS